MAVGKVSRKQVDAVRGRVFDRDGRVCCVANSVWSQKFPCQGRLEIQHRVKRGAGGSALLDGPEFLVGMCSLHNGMDGGSHTAFRQSCLENGWSARHWVAGRWPMSRVPIHLGARWYLLSGFERYEISETTALDMMNEIYGEES
jgi:hypothetical protein